jgi:hypothetical protein
MTIIKIMLRRGIIKNQISQLVYNDNGVSIYYKEGTVTHKTFIPYHNIILIDRILIDRTLEPTGG